MQFGLGGCGGGFQGSKSRIYRTDITSNENYFAYGGTQTTGGTGYENGSFGKGGGFSEYATTHTDLGGAGGGGFYGGGAGKNPAWSSGGGGSGYIGNDILSNKHMTGYDVDTSNDTKTKTYSTTNVSATPISDYAKKGNGYARITNKN